jgi:hypothetical protein
MAPSLSSPVALGGKDPALETIVSVITDDLVTFTEWYGIGSSGGGKADRRNTQCVKRQHRCN